MRIEAESFNLQEMMEWTFALCAAEQEEVESDVVPKSVDSMATKASAPEGFMVENSEPASESGE